MTNKESEASSNVKKIHLRIVSAEKQIFSDAVLEVKVNGIDGGIGIKPGHSPLLTLIDSSNLVYFDLDGNKNIVNLYGGVLEIQPHSVTVLVDTALRAEDIDESKALEAKELAEKNLINAAKDRDYSAALSELSRALSQIKAVDLVKNRR
jgi:F-type H+-transporting ATPase subunit epsilon